MKNRAKAKPARRLSDAMLEKLPRAEKGARYGVSDSQVPGLRVRVTAKGCKTFVVWKRLEGRQFWTTRYLGKFPGMTVDEARTKAREFLVQIEAGLDPKDEAKRAAQARMERPTFTAAAEDFIREKLPSERSGKDTATMVRRALIPAWGGKALVDIKPRDVAEMMLAQKPSRARNLRSLANRMFNWMIARQVYGIEINPCTPIKANAILGEVTKKERTLSDDELRALWIASGEEAYPAQQTYRLLMLNGLRLNEVVKASEPEFNFAARDWLIPKERMKSKNHKARPHLVPLTSASLEILGTLPNFSGPFLLSLKGGNKPAALTSHVKNRIDKRMLELLREMAVARGDDPDKIVLPHWTNHDIRRTLRSNLPALRDRRGHKFPEEVCEAVIAHAPPVIVGTYNKYSYAQEKLEALEAWAERLQEIVINSTVKTVIFMPTARRA